jgi:hypothetical protein
VVAGRSFIRRAKLSHRAWATRISSPGTFAGSFLQEVEENEQVSIIQSFIWLRPGIAVTVAIRSSIPQVFDSCPS